MIDLYFCSSSTSSVTYMSWNEKSLRRQEEIKNKLMWEDDINQVVKPRVNYQKIFHQEWIHFPFSRGTHYVFLFALLYIKWNIKEIDLLGFRMCFTLKERGKNSGPSNLIWKRLNHESLHRPWLVMNAKKHKYYF